jgi:hypothetical protein
MAEAGAKNKVGATPSKLVLIAVLAVVFVGVLVFQFSGKEEPPPPREKTGASESRPRPAAGRTRVAASPRGDGDVRRKDRTWPQIALKEVLQHDPFAVPRALRPPEEPKPATPVLKTPDKSRQEELERQREQALAAIRKQGVQMIFLGEKEQVALIGDRRVRVGDLFDGFRVTKIGPDGVTLSEHATDEK